MSKQSKEARERITQLRSSLTISQADLTSIDRAMTRLEKIEKFLVDLRDDDSSGNSNLSAWMFSELKTLIMEGEEL
jgi:hypothetical protein